jgi:hypothetical protein
MLKGSFHHADSQPDSTRRSAALAEWREVMG